MTELRVPEGSTFGTAGVINNLGMILGTYTIEAQTAARCGFRDISWTFCLRRDFSAEVRLPSTIGSRWWARRAERVRSIASRFCGTTCRPSTSTPALRRMILSRRACSCAMGRLLIMKTCPHDQRRNFSNLAYSSVSLVRCIVSRRSRMGSSLLTLVYTVMSCTRSGSLRSGKSGSGFTSA
jgi:hypothetical protein